MKCDDFKKNMIFYFDNELSTESKYDMQKHLNTCVVCSELYEKFSKEYAIIDSLKCVKPSSFLETRVMQAIENSKHRSSRYRRYLQPAFFMFLIVLSLFTGIFIGSKFNITTEVSDNNTQNLEQYFYELNEEKIEKSILTENFLNE